MKRVRMVLGGIGLVAVVAVVLGSVVALKRPASRSPLPLKVDKREATIDRGAYLVRHVMACFSCHSRRNYNIFGAPIVGPVGAGGSCFTEKWGVPGSACPGNLTPDKGSGIGGWTPGEIVRAIREGVDRSGNALYPLMPYQDYRALSDADAVATVSYLLSQKPRRRKNVERSEIDFPTSWFIKGLPEPLPGTVPDPPRSNPVKYGEYLATLAGCKSCHTPIDSKQRLIADKLFAGGREFESPYGKVVAPNISPHASGLRKWTRQEFVQHFIRYRHEGAARKLKPSENTPMPWLHYAGMTEQDLGMIFDYLMAQPGVEG